MKALSKTLLITLAALMVCTMGAYARTKAFKKEWTQLDGPVFYKCNTVVDKLPKGSTVFSIYGFDKDTDLPADFTLMGNIVDADKQNGVWTFAMEHARLSFTGGTGRSVTFLGDLNFTVTRGKNKREVLTFYPGTGEYIDGNTKYRLIEEGLDRVFWNTGQLVLTVNCPKNATPELYADVADLNLPRMSVLRRPSRENMLSDYFAGRNRSVKVRGADFARMVMKNPARANYTNFPEYREYVTRYYYKDGRTPVRTVTDSIDLGDRVVTAQYEARRSGNAVTMTMEAGTARFEDGKPIYATWNTDGNGGVYRGDTLYRYDGSKLVGLSFDPAVRPDGYMITQLEVLGSIADPNIYDFTEAARSSGLSVRRYVSADGSVAENLEGDVIPSVMDDKSYIGPDRTLADVRGRARSVVFASDQSEGMESTFTFDAGGYFTGPIINYALLNMAFDNPALGDLTWEDLGYSRTATRTLDRAVGGLSMDYKVSRDGSGYISEIATTTSPGYEDMEGSTTIQWINNHPSRLWIKGWEDEPTIYTYDGRERLVKEQYESKDGEPGVYTWEYTYNAEDGHGSWTERTVHFSFAPAVGSAEEPVEQTWTETRRIVYY